MNTNNTQNPNSNPQQLQVMTILCGAMTMSVIMLGVVLFITQNFVLDQALFNSLIKDPSFMILLIVGVVLIAARIPVSNTLFKNALQQPGVAEDKNRLIQAYMAPFIIRLALAEAGAIAGFVAAFVHKESTGYLLLGAAAIFAILREFPSMAKIQDRAKMLMTNRMSRSR